MKRNIFFTVGVVVIIIINAIAFTQKNYQEKTLFNVNTANQSFDVIQKSIELRKDYVGIVYYLGQLDSLERGAKKCVVDSEAHLKTITELLKSTEVDRVSQLQRADIQYLQGKQTYYIKQLSECRLFVYRSEEVSSRYKDIVLELSANQILKRATPVWKIQEFHWKELVSSFDWDKAISVSGVELISENQWVLFFLILAIIVFIGSYLRQFLNHVVKEGAQLPVLWRSFLHVLSSYVVFCSVFGFSSAFLNLIYQEFSTTPTLELISHAALISVLLLSLVKFIFYPASSMPGVVSLPDNLGRLFYRCAIFLVVIVFIGYAMATFLREQPFPPVMIELSRTFFLTFVAFVVAWMFFLGFRSVHEVHLDNANFIACSMFFAVVATALVVIEWLGYHRLDIFLIKGLFSSAIFTLIAVLAWRLVEALYVYVNEKQNNFSRKVHLLFGVKFNKKMNEMFLIKLAAYLVILGFYVITLLKSWSISPVFVDLVIDGLWQGFKFWGFKIIPSRIVFGLISFSVILLFGRFLAASIAKKHRFKGEEDTQIAISTITIYISFSLALIFAMVVVGVDFTGLAIIAGALSVGVGLGLQNIVTNFVSGLILLIEKPIKPGDRIVIGKTEGFVRKIRIRSTQIATLAKEDVIVPNADLVTQQVTNYMFRDRNSRVTCQVGVAYDSDIDLVKKVLLEVAAKHPDVVHDAPNEPVVLFMRFGESALIFDLMCVIHDVNKKYFVVSELNFAINAAFRHHAINIAFPQREVHIKDYAVVKEK